MLREVELPDVAPGFPPRVEEYLAEADRRLDEFLGEISGATIPGFVPADFRRLYPVIDAVARSNLAPGNAFLEWGSGFGVVAGLASLTGFDAFGIEFNEELVAAARSLALDFDLPVVFARGTFVPPGGGAMLDRAGDFDWLFPGGTCGYEGLGMDPDEFDFVYAYPWPGEEEVLEALFDRYAAEGALLLTYHGEEEIRLRRRVPALRSRSRSPR